MSENSSTEIANLGALHTTFLIRRAVIDHVKSNIQ